MNIKKKKPANFVAASKSPEPNKLQLPGKVKKKGIKLKRPAQKKSEATKLVSENTAVEVVQVIQPYSARKSEAHTQAYTKSQKDISSKEEPDFLLSAKKQAVLPEPSPGKLNPPKKQALDRAKSYKLGNELYRNLIHVERAHSDPHQFEGSILRKPESEQHSPSWTCRGNEQ